MAQTSFEFTPEQKGLLATLSRETDKPIPVLLAEALDVLQEHERPGHAKDETNGNREAIAPKPIWEQFAEAFDDVPEEELARLPTDLAAQVDHYVYGLPKVLSQSCFLESFGVRKSLNLLHNIFRFYPKIELCDRTHWGAQAERRGTAAYA